jgi:hypothetical protein
LSIHVLFFGIIDKKCKKIETFNNVFSTELTPNLKLFIKPKTIYRYIIKFIINYEILAQNMESEQMIKLK